MRLPFKWVDREKQIILYNVGNHHAINWGIEQKGRGISRSLSDFGLRETLVFLGLRTQMEFRPLALLGLMGPFSLYNHSNKFHITNLLFWFPWFALFWNTHTQSPAPIYIHIHTFIHTYIYSIGSVSLVNINI